MGIAVILDFATEFATLNGRFELLSLFHYFRPIVRTSVVLDCWTFLNFVTNPVTLRVAFLDGRDWLQN